MYATLPQVPTASPGGNIYYISGSPAMAGGALPPQPTGQVYVQQPQLVHQTAQYMPYAQGGPSPLVPMLPLSQQPSPQSVTYQQLPSHMAPLPQYAVHPLLSQPTSRSGIWEVFRPVAPILNKIYTDVNLPATQPYQLEMRLVSADMPWTIPVRAGNGQFVTVGEVYEAIFNTLQGVVTHPEYRLTEARTRKKMADQYQKRCTQYPLEHNEHARGIKRVDYLLSKNVFAGLKRDDKLAEELMMLNDQKMQCTCVLVLMSR